MGREMACNRVPAPHLAQAGESRVEIEFDRLYKEFTQIPFIHEGNHGYSPRVKQQPDCRSSIIKTFNGIQRTKVHVNQVKTVFSELFNQVPFIASENLYIQQLIAVDAGTGQFHHVLGDIHGGELTFRKPGCEPMDVETRSTAYFQRPGERVTERDVPEIIPDTFQALVTIGP